MVKSSNKFLVLLFLALLLLDACGPSTPQERATAAALKSFKHIVKGNCEGFLRGKAGYDSLPEAYRDELLGAVKQWVANEQQRRGGIVSVTGTKAQMDSVNAVMHVFVLLQFGDSTKEEMLVPMTEENGHWMMR